MHFRFDHFSKKLLRKLFSTRGTVLSELEVAVDAQRIDVYFVPAPSGAQVAPELGRLAAMARSPAIFEPFHHPPSFDEIRGSVRKLLAWHHLQSARARRRRSAHPALPPTERARQPPPGGPPMPVLWIISSGRPHGGLEGFAFQALRGWPRGFYAWPPSAIPVRLVIANELPATRDTLALRLMGRGAAQRRAAAELAALPADAWERSKIAPLLVSLQKRVAKARASRPLTKEEKEILVTGLQILNAAEEKGTRTVLLHQFARKLGRPLTDRERTTVARRLRTLGPERLGDVVLDLAPDELETWLARPRAR